MINDIVNLKDPFDKLWSNSLNFHNSYEKWMNGELDLPSTQVMVL